MKFDPHPFPQSKILDPPLGLWDIIIQPGPDPQVARGHVPQPPPNIYFVISHPGERRRWKAEWEMEYEERLPQLNLWIRPRKQCHFYCISIALLWLTANESAYSRALFRPALKTSLSLPVLTSSTGNCAGVLINVWDCFVMCFLLLRVFFLAYSLIYHSISLDVCCHWHVEAQRNATHCRERFNLLLRARGTWHATSGKSLTPGDRTRMDRSWQRSTKWTTKTREYLANLSGSFVLSVTQK